MSNILEQEIIQLIIRMLSAATLGAIIGYEREFRGKGAGVRTHMLVAIGACLFILISKYGFGDSERFDAARVAAGVVSGIGFLGGGLIIKSKSNMITGMTTAAGLWVTGAIGLAAGSGMVLMSVICTALVLICMEILNIVNKNLGYRQATAIFSSQDKKALQDVIHLLNKESNHFALTKQADSYKLEVMLRVPKKENTLEMLKRLEEIKDVQLESLE